MSSHANFNDDLEAPPPSAQRSSWAPADVRRNGTASSRRVPRRRDEQFSSRDSVVRAAASRTTPHAVTTNPAVADDSSSLSKARNHHNPSPNPSSSRLGSNNKPAHQSSSPSSAAPATRTFFDPWNSSSTGHQRAENRLSGSTSWRDSRNLKLAEQYSGGLAGGKRLADTVGAGSEDFGTDGRKANGGWERGAKGLRTGGQKSLVEVWGASKASTTAKKSSQEEYGSNCEESQDRDELHEGADGSTTTDEEGSIAVDDADNPSRSADKQIFHGLCFYFNGSTAPLVSDHKLKQMVSTHGARHSIALGRRTVTHVILGTTCGGGLAASKIQKEVAKTGGKSVKFITADWVLESIKANRRLPESRFSPLKLAPKNQNSVLGMTRSLKPSPPAG